MKSYSESEYAKMFMFVIEQWPSFRTSEESIVKTIHIAQSFSFLATDIKECTSPRIFSHQSS